MALQHVLFLLAALLLLISNSTSCASRESRDSEGIILISAEANEVAQDSAPREPEPQVDEFSSIPSDTLLEILKNPNKVNSEIRNRYISELLTREQSKVYLEHCLKEMCTDALRIAKNDNDQIRYVVDWGRVPVVFHHADSIEFELAILSQGSRAKAADQQARVGIVRFNSPYKSIREFRDAHFSILPAHQNSNVDSLENIDIPVKLKNNHNENEDYLTAQMTLNDKIRGNSVAFSWPISLDVTGNATK